MRGGVITLFEIALAGAVIIAGSILAVWLLVKVVKGLIWLLNNGAKGVSAVIRHVFRFIRSMISDALRAVGALVTAIVLLPLAILNLLFFRWSMCKHYLNAVEDEVMSFALCIYRLGVGHPLRLVGMTALTDGIERRIPDVVARAPRTGGMTASNLRDGKFEGYKVTGMLPAGGSGARLFLAKPRAEKLADFQAAGFNDPGQVVIKAFSLSTGSTMPQIVRESRALESARKLGLILEHELTEKSFHYVMPFVPGEGLDQVITKMHEKSGNRGLSDRQIRVALGYVGDVLFTLDAFHSGGLWHKDIKPSNLIISEGRAHLVDLGLVTPLASAMTLTTHGTEYYRDPEMVRLALRGVKVAEVDGAKFDIYSTGAVLFSLIENSFPAQGSLSQLTRRAPDVINWIIRRSMADMESRYGSVTEMLADVRTVLAADDPYKVRPADLPSVNGRKDQGVPRASFADLNAPVSHSGPGRTAPLHTGTVTRMGRRSTGRTLVASFLGLMFLFGVVGFMLFSVAGPMQEEYSQPVQFTSDPAGWCELNASEFASVQSLPIIPTLPSNPDDSAPEEIAAHQKLVDAKQAAEAKIVKKYERHWSSKLRKELNLVSQEAAQNNPARKGAGTILVLEDLSAANLGPWVTALESALERRDFELVGSLTGEMDEPRDIELEAEARNVIGIVGSDDPEVSTRLGRFLADKGDVDAIIWIEDGERDGSLRYQVIHPSQLTSATFQPRNYETRVFYPSGGN